MKTIAAAVLVASLGAPLASFASGAPNFAGKSITMIIPSTPGGGTDTTGRAIGAFAANADRYSQRL